MNQNRTFHCTIAAAMCFIGGKYKPIILWHLIDGPKRFNKLQKFIPQATPRMLTMQLRQLESDGLIHREVFPVVPPKTEYSFTELGSTLIPLIKEIREWGVYYFEATGQKNPCDKDL
ncbi:winged helix-turn-helix transcriptional regulator [Clostridium estertheticum]|uniref:winged helix-turn-helix transcriptional regulator n=1 Tax=Clostridium estertheticum TaxID=238834 RepID=UPI001C7DF71E|nr:helix-turn-helix domain-containing protein [Clostridium estertheticum]MBX4265119.1 helix-turn-helix transcriptional regulator [Clostridium estertheticum]WLC88582.1 helix-turn-helix transcriptional regulator [Clostridium estertheticum]